MLNPGQYVEVPALFLGGFLMIGVAAWLMMMRARDPLHVLFAVLLTFRAFVDITHGIGHIFEPVLAGGLRGEPATQPWQAHYAFLFAVPFLVLGYLWLQGRPTPARTGWVILLASLVPAFLIFAWYGLARTAFTETVLGTALAPGTFTWLKFRAVEPFYAAAAWMLARTWLREDDALRRRGLLVLSLAFVLLSAFNTYRFFNSVVALVQGDASPTAFGAALWDAACVILVLAALWTYVRATRSEDEGVRGAGAAAALAVLMAFATGATYLLMFWQGDARLANETIVSHFGAIWFLSFPVLASYAVTIGRALEAPAQAPDVDVEEAEDEPRPRRKSAPTAG